MTGEGVGADARVQAPPGAGALAGVRVLDLSRLVSGNIATHVLADLGADVIKVEPLPRGDDLRNWRTNGVSTYWKVYCRNKRSLALDLRRPEGMAALRRLIPTAQVLVENFRPGTLEKMGLAPDALLAANPDLVILRISGWGQTGPWADRGGFGSLVEALCGFAAMNGYEDRPPVLPPFALADSMAGLYGAVAALNGVRHAERGGGGQVIDLSLFDPIHSLIGPLALEHQLTGQAPKRAGSRSPTHAPRNVYETADGRFIALSAGMEGTVQRLFAAIGRPDMVGDPRFASHAARIENIDALDAVIGDFVKGRSLEENLAFFAAQDVTAGEICDAAQLADHPYAIGRGVIVEQPDPELGTVRTPAPPLRFAGTPATIRTPAPELGEHSAEILREAGYSEGELAAMQAAGAVSCMPGGISGS
ncbi:CoA transferase [Burkholderiaceae bacterium FT117]|uniref:CaiB/BaiF CoA transferase family protein n=1 Tax=Zeimonas sediminis TaxID=2944268 RepID=UPI002342C86D|nr:CoA transferase [Zeimonas sediminis]MCM5572069.1 CoA transferase [Zeimonas sediminis]